MYLNYYNKKNVIPLIIDLFLSEGFDVSEENIKSWSQPKMNYNDILLGINYVKSLNKNCIVYTNIVMLKEQISKDNSIKIFDSEDIKQLCLKYKRYDILDYFNNI